mgnify:CR=1 FL=1
MRIYLRLLAVFLLLFAGNILYAEAQQEKRCLLYTSDAADE